MANWNWSWNRLHCFVICILRKNLLLISNWNQNCKLIFEFVVLFTFVWCLIENRYLARELCTRKIWDRPWIFSSRLFSMTLARWVALVLEKNFTTYLLSNIDNKNRQTRTKQQAYIFDCLHHRWVFCDISRTGRFWKTPECSKILLFLKGQIERCIYTHIYIYVYLAIFLKQI